MTKIIALAFLLFLSACDKNQVSPQSAPGSHEAPTLGAFSINVIASMVQNAATTVSWSASSRASSYLVILSSSPICAQPAIGNYPNVNQTSITFTTEAAVGTYYLCVFAQGSNGVTFREASNSPMQVAVAAATTVLVAQSGTPADPTSLLVQRTSSTAAASWVAGDGGTAPTAKYRVRSVSGSTPSDPFCVGGVESTTPAYSLAGLSPDSYYSLRVCAVSAAGEVSPGATATYRTLSSFVPRPVPTCTAVILSGNPATMGSTGRSTPLTIAVMTTGNVTNYDVKGGGFIVSSFYSSTPSQKDYTGTLGVTGTSTVTFFLYNMDPNDPTPWIDARAGTCSVTVTAN